MLVFGENGGADVSVVALGGQVEQLLVEDGIRGTVGVHCWRQEVPPGDGCVAFALEVSIVADAALLSDQALQGIKRSSIGGVVSNRPALGEWIAIEESGRLLQDLGRCLIETICLEQAGLYGFICCYPIPREVVVIRSRVQARTGATNVAGSRGLPRVVTRYGDQLGSGIELVIQSMVGCAGVLREGNNGRDCLTC